MNIIEPIAKSFLAEPFLDALPAFHLPVLFGDVDDWIRIIVILFFVLGPILNALGGAGKVKKLGPQNRPGRVPPLQPRRRPALPQNQPGNQPQQPGQGRRALENEIEEFLQRAGQGKRQRAPERAAKPQPAMPRQQAKETPRVSLEQRRLNKEAKQRQAAKLKKSKAAAARRQQQEAARAGQRQPFGQSVSEHVRDHIESHPVSEHGRSLGEKIGRADEHVEQHLHDVFDHKLGALEKKQVFNEAEGTDAAVWDKRVTVSPASKIRAMLKEPESVRNAIVLTEVFNRPVSLDE